MYIYQKYLIVQVVINLSYRMIVNDIVHGARITREYY